MKIQEIEIKPKTIVLGVFNTEPFDVLRSMGAHPYYTFIKWGITESGRTQSIIKTIEKAAEIADSVVFVLDEVQFPINTKKSVTCLELDMICRNEELFNKTVFVRGEEVINFDKNLVI